MNDHHDRLIAEQFDIINIILINFEIITYTTVDSPKLHIQSVSFFSFPS